MATGQSSEVIQHLRKAVLLRDGAGLTDGQLLDCFLARRDEAAFAALVGRHGPMVWGVCRRNLRNHHDAEDAFQATFLVLARKAASVVPRGMVANWLYGVACNTALKAKAMADKRRRRERQVTEMPEPAVIEHDLWRDVQPLLDEELKRLPDKYRVVMVLCDLEGKTRKEAARQLGCPEGTVAGRLARARAMLAKRLARHGLAVSGAALAAVLSQEVVSAGVPTSVVSSTIKAASLFAVGKAAATGAISVKVAALTEGVLKTMLLTKLKIATAVLLVAVAITGVGAGGLLHQMRAGEPAKAQQVTDKKEKQAADTPKKETVKTDKERIQGTWHMVSAEVDGVPAPFAGKPEEDAKMLAVFAGDKWTTGFFKGEGFTFKLDSDKKPKAIDLQPAEDAKKTLLGIYELDGDDLKICICTADLIAPGKQERPAAFATKEGSNTMLVVLKRQKH
jgi:RNA polymerase sigma factor (sigma-70 family)